MKREKKLILLFCFAFLFVFTGTAFAGADTSAINSLTTAFENALQPLQDKLAQNAIKLFSCLAFAQFSWSCYQIILDGKSDIGAYVMSMCKTIIYIGFFYTICSNGVGWMSEIATKFSTMCGGSPDSINNMVTTLFNMADAPQKALDTFYEAKGKDLVGVTEIANDIKYVGAIFMTWLGGAIIAGIMAMAFIEAIYIKIKLYVVTCFSVLALGFGGLTYTKDIAIGGIKKVIASAVELMVVYALLGVGESVFSYFENYTISDFSDSYVLTSLCIVAALVFFSLFKQLPPEIGGMFGAAGGGGGGLLGAAAAISGAAMSIGRAAHSMEKSAAKMAGGAIKAPAKIGGMIDAIKEKGFGGALKEGISNRFNDAKNNSRNSLLGRNKDNDWGGTGNSAHSGHVDPPPTA